MRSTVIRVIGSVIVVTLLSQAVWALVRIMGITLFADARYWCTWGPVASSLTVGIPSAVFLYWSAAINVVTALIFTLAYRMMKKNFVGGVWKKGLKFSSLIFFVGSLPMLAMGAILMYVSPALIAVAIITSLIVTLVNGIIVAALNRY